MMRHEREEKNATTREYGSLQPVLSLRRLDV